MKEIRINEADIAELKVSSLPSRPTAPRALGGYGYTAIEMKAAFDKLPLFIAGKFNLLLESISKEGEGSVAASIPTGIKEEHTLSDMLSDILTGVFATYLSVSGTTLSESIAALEAQINQSLALATANSAKLTSQSNSIADQAATLLSHSTELLAMKERIVSSEGEISQNKVAITTLGTKVDEIAASSGRVDTENISIDCGSPADLDSTEGET